MKVAFKSCHISGINTSLVVVFADFSAKRITCVTSLTAAGDANDGLDEVIRAEKYENERLLRLLKRVCYYEAGRLHDFFKLNHFVSLDNIIFS